jgi:hypothetical protein
MKTKSNSQVLAEIRAWFARWRSSVPDRDDAEGWNQLVTEICEAIPIGGQDIFINLVNEYIAMLEEQSK